MLPQLARPVANAITTRANQMGSTNIISSAHYPINGVLEIYERDRQKERDLPQRMLGRGGDDADRSAS